MKCSSHIYNGKPPYVDHKHKVLNWKSRHKILTKETKVTFCNTSLLLKCQNMYDVVLECFEIPRNLPLLPAKLYVTHFAGHTIVFLHLQSTWLCLKVQRSWRFTWEWYERVIPVLLVRYLMVSSEKWKSIAMSIDVNQTSAVLTCYNCQDKGHMARCVFILQSSAILHSRWTFLSPQGLFGSKKGEGQFWADLLQLSGSRTHGQVNNNWIWSTCSCV